MANYRKSFNFRNGVQVDDDNLVVNSVGNVGIGTTIPTELLDVRGTAKVVGLVTANNVYVTGVSTFSDVRIGTGITITASSGIITATAFYGNGATLSNLPTSQWVDVDVGLGFTSIYNAGNVGIATTNPLHTFQIGGNPTSQNGISINSTGNVNATGVITASSFSGSGAGVTSINASNISTGTIAAARVPQLNNSSMPDNISVSGIVTATGGFVGAVTGNVTGNLTGNVTGTATTATRLSGTPNITVGVVTASKIIANVVEVPSTGITTVSQLLHVGTSGTAFSALVSGKTGIGTENPTSELQIRKTSGSLLEVISETGQARVSIGQSVGVGKSTGVIRFGNLAKTLDFINNDTGSVRNIIHAGNSGVSTGDFKWIYGQTNAERMTLTWDGNLGINQSVPTHKLHVVGTSTVTGNAWFGGNVTVAGSINGSITLDDVITSNINTTSGVSTISTLNVTGSVDFGNTSFVGLGTNVGIGTDSGFQNTGLTVNNRIRTNNITVTDGVDVASGYVTSFSTRSSGGFSSGIGTQFVRITYETSPDRVVFTVAGIGSTSLQLF